MTTLAAQLLDELDESQRVPYRLNKPTKVIDFDTEKEVQIPAGTYEVIDDSDPSNVLISDTRGNLFYVTP